MALKLRPFQRLDCLCRLAVPFETVILPVRVAIRENIAHRERARKIRDIGLQKLQVLWDGQMTPQEKDSLRKLTINPCPTSDATENLAEKAVTWAEEHLFEQRSVVHEHELWRHALEHGKGQNVSLAQIQDCMQRMELSFLVALSGNQRSLIPDGQPMVLEIIAAEAKAAQADGRS